MTLYIDKLNSCFNVFSLEKLATELVFQSFELINLYRIKLQSVCRVLALLRIKQTPHILTMGAHLSILILMHVPVSDVKVFQRFLMALIKWPVTFIISYRTAVENNDLPYIPKSNATRNQNILLVKTCTCGGMEPIWRIKLNFCGISVCLHRDLIDIWIMDDNGFLFIFSLYLLQEKNKQERSRAPTLSPS